MLTPEDKTRINAAIVAAESRTRGEIFCVLAQEVSRYREVPLLWASLAAFVIPALLVWGGLHRLAPGTSFSVWTDGSAQGMEDLILSALTVYGLAQAVIFFAVVLFVSIPGVRRALTPPALKTHRVRQAARRHFAASGARLSPDEPHVLIFACLSDRRVELVAHDAIQKQVGDTPWDASVAAVVDGMKAGSPGEGFVRAIGTCGEALAVHFPPQGGPRNQLPNDILET